MIATEQRIAAQLERGERILWTGAPRQGFLLRRSALLQVPFALLWTGFAILWEVDALRMGPIFFQVFGVPFVLVGLYFVFGRFLVDIRTRARTAYGLTDRRIVIVSGKTSRSVRMLPLRTLSELTLEVGANGCGTITFGAVPFAERWAAAAPSLGMARSSTPRFELVPSAKDVYGRIREAQGNAR